MEASRSKQHEDLMGTNSLVVRQSRHDSEGEVFIEFNNRKHHVFNYSLFGLGMISDRELQTDSYLDGVNIYCGDLKITTLTCQVKRVRKIDDRFEVGLEVINTTVPVESINRVKDFNSLVRGIEEKKEYYNILPLEFKMAVVELSDNLNKLEKYVKSFEDREYTHSREYFETRNSLVETVSQHLSLLLLNTAEKMKSGFSQAGSDNLKTAFAYFREHVGRYLFQSPFTKRSYEKPRGYAGDYLMMSQIYSNNSFANSLFGSCMEAAVQSFGEPSAVRNRAHYLSNKILAKINSDKGHLKFLSVACGPAEEVRVLLENVTQEQLDRCEFHLLDQDEEALQYAQRNILDTAMKLGKKIKLRLINRGIKEVLVGGVSEQYDTIYSSGLFDYFSDPVASKACKVLYQSVKVKGSLIIGNFNTTNTNWFGMLALFDWSLILRSSDDLKRLFHVDGSRIGIECEENNINLFCILTKDS